ncbi:MAG: SGNH/GDSL hydrolase family protein, partial [Lentisphaerota bacterium]
LKEIVRVLKAAKIKTVWIRTTHADENVHNKLNNVFWRFAKDVEDYNAVADAITAEAGFPSIDLHGFTKSLGGNPFCDHIHFNEDVRRLQAAFIAGHINYLKGYQ